MEVLDSLFTRYMNNECTMNEINQLLQYFKVAEDETQLKSLIISAWNKKDHPDFSTEEEEQLLDSKLAHIYDRLKKNIESENNPVQTAKVRSLTPWYSIAAGIVLICVVGLGILSRRSQEVKTEIASVYEIQPGGNKAMLVLADGRKLDLSQEKEGILTRQGSTAISKIADGQIDYTAQVSGDNKSAGYNQIEVPRGGQFQVKLPDGTHVWLNSASTLRYPTSFAGKTRSVSLTGEGYFEVAKNKDQPFTVSVNDVVVKDIGTHFNIMAYHNESSVNTTLLEGSVEVSKNGVSKTMIPGQEARVNKDIQVGEANIDEAVAWKNADFLFANSDVQSTMRKIERWYNVKVVYEGELPVKHFNGKISRNTDIKKLLDVLALTGGVQFKIEGDIITVSR